jgi:hypothetical protein
MQTRFVLARALVPENRSLVIFGKVAPSSPWQVGLATLDAPWILA